jgi:hypothetical protein
MISRKTAGVVSTIAVGGMFIVAWSEFAHGKPAAEVHLITAAPLTIGSTIVFTVSPFSFIALRKPFRLHGELA